MTLFIRDHFFDLEACQRVRAAMDAGTADDAEVLASGVVVDVAVRRTASIDVDATTLQFVEQALDAARPRLATFFGRQLPRREGAGFLRYPPGGFYRPHRDRAHVAEWSDAALRCITMVLFLNHDFRGGELRLIPDAGGPPRDVAPRAGTLVAFDASILHAVLPVFDGTRDAIVDWLLES